MTTNPFLEASLARATGEPDPFDGVPTSTLAPLAIAHELARMNDLTEATNGPLRAVSDAPEGFEAAPQRVISVPDEAEGDRRIAAAARRWAELYARRNETAAAAGYFLSCSELAEAVRQVDAR